MTLLPQRYFHQVLSALLRLIAGGSHFAIFEIFALISSNCDHSGLECFKKYSSPILIIRPCLPLRTYKFQGEDYENKTDDTK